MQAVPACVRFEVCLVGNNSNPSATAQLVCKGGWLFEPQMPSLSRGAADATAIGFQRTAHIDGNSVRNVRSACFVPSDADAAAIDARNHFGCEAQPFHESLRHYLVAHAEEMDGFSSDD